jgi:hypothetical protein
MLGCKCLNLVEYFLRPLKLVIISYHDRAFTAVSNRFHASLNEDIHACSVIASTPGRVCVEALEDFSLREWVKAVVQDRLKIIETLAVGKLIY